MPAARPAGADSCRHEPYGLHKWRAQVKEPQRRGRPPGAA